MHEISFVMDSFQRFQDDGYKNWIKTTMGLERLKTRLCSFLDNETETYHKFLQDKIHIRAECQNKCDFKKVNPPGSNKPSKSKQVPGVNLCAVCEPWRNAIRENHTSKGGLVYWDNSKPYLWPKEKWEVAKVYMPRGNANHKSVGQFDISAFLNLMSFCKHFSFVKNILLTSVTNVRNQVMHSADFRVEKAALESHLQRIRNLGKALEERAPDLSTLGEEMDQIQNTDFSLILHSVENEKGPQLHGSSEKDFQEALQVHELLILEQQILKDKMESLAQRYEEDRENALTKEELQGMRVFLEGNKDLEERLAPELERLRELEEAVEQHGQQINTLTGRVDVLEKSSHTHEPEFGTERLMYKNHLYEEAARQKWSSPVFSEIREANGVRGRVEVRGQTFTGSRVFEGIKNAHQEVAKLALKQLANEVADLSQLANDTEEGRTASSSGTDQSESVSRTDSAFFGSVTVVLNTDIISEEGQPGETEAVESAYKKLAALFGLAQSESASSYKEVVLQHCTRRDIPPPEETSQSDCCTLKFTGPITFHDSEGFSKKRPTHQQAAKMALKGLSGILGNKTVLEENYIGALKELLEAQGLEKPTYDVTVRARGAGEIGGMDEGERGEAAGDVTQRGGDQRGEGGGEGEIGRVEGGGMGGAEVCEFTERGGRTDQVESCTRLPAAPMMLNVQPAESQVPPPSAMDTSVAMESQVTPTPVEERSTSADGGRFLSCVTVCMQKKLAPHEASSQEGAVQAAYSSLLQALSLDNTTTAGGERQCVQEFLRQAGCGPPEDVCELIAEGRYRCTLGIVGELTIHSPEGASKKQQAEHWAAKEALRRLEGVLGGDGSVAGGNYKGRLQELLVKDGGGAVPHTTYTTKDTQNPTTASGQMTRDRAVIGSTLPADRPPIIHTDTMESVPEDSNPPPSKRSAVMESDGQMEDIGQFLSCVTVRMQKKLAPHEASSQEGAVQAAYSSLLQALSLDNTTTAGGERQCVQEFLRQAGCGPPEDVCELTAEGRYRCTLGIVGELTIHSPEGASKKQQAEHWAAKEALRRLEGVLGGDGSVAGGNYKGRLQELLVKDGGGAVPHTTYTTKDTQNPKTASGQVTRDRAVIGSTLPADRPPIIHTDTMESVPEDSNPPPSKRSAMMESDGQMEEVRRLLVLLGLQPPCVVCEDVCVESWYEWSVRVSFDHFTFQNQTLFTSKMDATRSSYLSLGLAGEICQPEDGQAKGKVKQFFSKHSFPLPKEVHEESEQKKFSCSLKDITCVFTYSGEGLCEATARQSACHKALSCLSPLIGYVALVVQPSSTEGAELRLRTLLEGAELTLSDSTLTRTQYRSSAQLKFSGYRLEMEGQRSKKETRAQLSQRLLGLLGEENVASSTGSSVRNALDEWFVTRRLEKPVFEDTDEKFGTRITFSAPFLCSYSDWQITREKAKRRLVEELQRLVQYLSNK